MGVFKWLRTEPWDPTPAQEEGALRLAEPDGGFVRTYADGMAELRTTERGGLRRYIIREDGEAALVESGPGSWRYAWSQGLWAAGILLAFGAIVPAVLKDHAEIVPWWIPPAGLIVVFGLAIGVVGLLIAAPEDVSIAVDFRDGGPGVIG